MLGTPPQVVCLKEHSPDLNGGSPRLSELSPAPCVVLLFRVQRSPFTQSMPRFQMLLCSMLFCSKICPDPLCDFSWVDNILLTDSSEFTHSSVLFLVWAVCLLAYLWLPPNFHLAFL